MTVDVWTTFMVLLWPFFLHFLGEGGVRGYVVKKRGNLGGIGYKATKRENFLLFG